MIWLKRFSPIILILAGWFGYTTVQDYLKESQRVQEEELAQIAARIWISTARFRNEPECYLEYRDSLLNAEGIDRDRFFDFFDSFKDKGEDLMPFSVRLRDLVDSLYLVELNKIDSSQKALDSIAGINNTDSVTN